MTVVIRDIKGLGTYWWFELFDYPEDNTEHIQKLLETTIREFDEHYSRFNPASYISRLNNGEAIINPPAELRELIDIGLAWEEKTNGLFTIGGTSILEHRGYDADYTFATQKKNLSHDESLKIDMQQNEIKLASGKLDFGGFGKGFLIDALATQLHELGVHEFLINGGGDMYATSHNDEPIQVHVEHPQKEKAYIARVPLLNVGFGVSSSYKRAWTDVATSEERNHFIHPKTPERTIQASSHIVAATALIADACATVTAIEPDIRTSLPEIQEYLILSEKQYISEGFRRCML